MNDENKIQTRISNWFNSLSEDTIIQDNNISFVSESKLGQKFKDISLQNVENEFKHFIDSNEKNLLFNK